MEHSSASPQDIPIRWGWPDLIAFSCFFVAAWVSLGIGLFLLLGVLGRDLQAADLSGMQLILIQVLLDVLLVSFLFFLAKKVHGWPFQEAIHWVRREPFSIGRMAAAGAFLALTILVVSNFMPTPTASSPLEKLLETPESLLALVVFGVAVAPLAEEIIFRGFLFTALVDVSGARVAVPVTALLFTLLHVQQLRGNWSAILLNFVVGYVLTMVRKRFDSMMPSFIMHVAYNGMLFGVPALGSLLEHGTE